MTGRCHRAAALAGADPEAVFQWAFIERVSTGLLLLRLGHRAQAERLLAGAGQLAAALAR
jgi:streptomycin 6-kinase